MRYLFNPYLREETEQITLGTHPFVPPHAIYEVVYASASIIYDLKWTVRQMGTQVVVARFANRDEAEDHAIWRAKQHIPVGLAFIREAE